MKRLSLQWRITLMTALLIAGACICLNLLLYRSGASGMDNLNGYVLQYQQDGGEDLTIEIPEDQMSDFLVQFSQEVYDTKTIFGRKGWCITAVVTLFSAAIAYFISGKALEPLKELAQQAEKVDQDNLVDVRLEENTVAEFRQLSQSVNQMLNRLAHSFASANLSIHSARLPNSSLFWMPYAAPAALPSHLHAAVTHAAQHNRVASPLLPCGKPSFEPNRLYSYSFHNEHNVSYCNQTADTPPEGYFP